MSSKTDSNSSKLIWLGAAAATLTVGAGLLYWRSQAGGGGPQAEEGVETLTTTTPALALAPAAPKVEEKPQSRSVASAAVEEAKKEELVAAEAKVRDEAIEEEEEEDRLRELQDVELDEELQAALAMHEEFDKEQEAKAKAEEEEEPEAEGSAQEGDDGEQEEEEEDQKYHPFHEAALSGNLAEMEKMLSADSGSKLVTLVDGGRTALHLASLGGQLKAVEVLLANGANVDAEDQEGNRALHCAAQENHHQITALLLKHHADATAVTAEAGMSALHCAADGGAVEVVKQLVDAGVPVDHPRKDNKRTPLHEASLAGSLPVVMTLLAFGADVKLEDEEGWSAVLFAALGGHVDIVRELIKNGGAKVNALGSSGLAAIHCAVIEAKVDVVKTLLIELGAQVNLHELEDGRTPLHLAAMMGLADHVEIAKMLLTKGADLAEEDDEGWTPLQMASLAGHPSIVKLFYNFALLNERAGIDIRKLLNSTNPRTGLAPIHLAAANDHIEVLETLLDLNYEALARGSTTRKALEDTAGVPPVDVNLIQEHDGLTALHAAAAMGLEDAVLLLLEFGADKEILDREGNAPYDLAVQNEHHEVASYLNATRLQL